MDTSHSVGRRRKTQNNTRTDILIAAQHCFVEHGYTHATLRMIGSMAHVNPSLIVHYFGNKKQLFIDASFFNLPHTFDIEVRLNTVPQEQWGKTLADVFVASLDCQWINIFLNLLRMSADNPKTADMLIAFFRHAMINEIQKLGLTHAEQRATLLASTIIGIHFTGHVMRIDEFIVAPSPVQHALFAAYIQSILTIEMP